MDDTTSGNYQSKQWGSSTSDSVEFIMERVQGAQLANFHSVYFHRAEFEDIFGAWHDLSYNGWTYQWILANSANQYMITFPSWPYPDYPDGSEWNNVFQRGT